MTGLKTLIERAIFSSLVLTCIVTGFNEDPRTEFYSYAVVQPNLHQVSLAKRDSNFEDNEEVVKLEFEAFGENFVVELKENKDLFSGNYKEILYDENGKEEVYESINEKKRKCYFHGRLPNVEDSWAAISTCDGISGVFYNGKETYYIKPNAISRNAEHLIFKASDRKNKNFRCGVEDDLFNIQDRRKEDLNTENLEDPYKSNKYSRYIEVVVVNDYGVFENHNRDKETVFRRTKEIINVASSLLSRLNTFVTLQTTLIWMRQSWVNVSSNAKDTLDNFLKYRKDSLQSYHPNDNAIFITNQVYDESVIGNAYPGSICTEDKSGENIRDIGDVADVGLVLAHEMGHNLGADHDEDECQCVEEYCIMFPILAETSHWSSCSESAIQRTYSSGKDRCLRNKPTKVEGPSCGNGYLEAGEECDCGTKTICEERCCDATTCRRLC